MTLDANFIIGLITGAILAWILHWLIYRDRSGDAAHAGHAHADTAEAELAAARAELTTLQENHESEIASCEEKLADAEAEIGLLRDRLETQAAQAIEDRPAESDDEVETSADLESSAAPSGKELTRSSDGAPASATAEDPGQVDTPAQPAETASPPVVNTPDDLKKIEGIGPKIENILHAAGILTYSKLAGTSVASLERIVRDDGGIKIAYPDTWPQQAGLAAAGKWEELDRLQDTLKGGRRV